LGEARGFCFYQRSYAQSAFREFRPEAQLIGDWLDRMEPPQSLGHRTQPSDTSEVLPGDQLAQTILSVGRGDRRALKDLYDSSAQQMLAICLAITRDRAVSESLLPQIFLEVWRKSAGFDAQRSRPMSWLAAIARESAVAWSNTDDRRLRGLGRVQPPHVSGELGTLPVHHYSDGPAPADPQNDLDAECEADLRNIYLEGLTYVQAAKLRNQPPATLRKRLRHAVLKIRGKLPVD
jgi:RNA polymerase sigma-70 factor (ECF subfamily)